MAITQWIKAADAYDGSRLTCLLSTGNVLYEGSTSGLLLQWDGVDTLTKLADQLNSQAIVNLIYDGGIYAGTYKFADGCRLFSFTGIVWSQVAPNSPNQDTSMIISHAGGIFNGTSKTTGFAPIGSYLYEFNGSNDWTLKASGLANSSILCMIDVGGTLYAGSTYAGGAFLSFDEVSAWNILQYKLISNMAIYGSLYGVSGSWLVRWNGSSWDNVVNGLGTSAILVVFLDDLYIASYSGLQKWNAVDGLTTVISGNPGAGVIFSAVVHGNNIYVGNNAGELYTTDYSPLAINRSSAWKGATAKLNISANWKVTGIKVAKGGNMLIGDAHDLIGDVTDTIAEYGGRHWKDII